MSIWSSIGRFFSRLFGSELGSKMMTGVRATEQYLPEIYQVVKWLAQMTPTRSDDEILLAAEKFGAVRAIAGRRGGEALAAIVVAWAARKWPDAPERRIRRAIELALAALKP